MSHNSWSLVIRVAQGEALSLSGARLIDCGIRHQSAVDFDRHAWGPRFPRSPIESNADLEFQLQLHLIVDFVLSIRCSAIC